MVRLLLLAVDCSAGTTLVYRTPTDANVRLLLATILAGGSAVYGAWSAIVRNDQMNKGAYQ